MSRSREMGVEGYSAQNWVGVRPASRPPGGIGSVRTFDGDGTLRRLMRAGMARLRYPGSDAEQLLLAPQDLRTADPSFSTEFYSGHFGLAGTYAELNGLSPFDIPPPSKAWAEALYGFGWLRHLRAADSRLAQEQANALFVDWVRCHRHASGLAWRPDIVGRRVISWLCNSVVVLDTEDARSYELFLRTLTAQLRYLSASYSAAPDGLPRLVAVMALVYAGLCVAEQQAVLDRYLKPLIRQLDRQILPDGGHISRNPMAVVELLLDLLPLRQCFVARDREPPAQIKAAIERAMGALRFFRGPGGALARFNGTGATPADALATVLAYDDGDTSLRQDAPDSAYGRMSRGTTSLMFDLGAAPAPALSERAHAGALSFEMFSGALPVIVNCGAPPPEHAEWRSYARSTRAHSTLSLDDASSGSFSGEEPGMPESVVTLTGPPHVEGTLETEGERAEMKGSHDGYAARFGLGHSRHVSLAATGELITGKDALSPAKARKAVEQPNAYAVRFHLHPDVSAVLGADERSVELTLKNGEAWRLSSTAAQIGLEDSLFFGDERGPRASLQVVLLGAVDSGEEARVSWSIERLQGPDGNAALPEVEALPQAESGEPIEADAATAAVENTGDAGTRSASSGEDAD